MPKSLLSRDSLAEKSKTQFSLEGPHRCQQLRLLLKNIVLKVSIGINPTATCFHDTGISEIIPCVTPILMHSRSFRYTQGPDDYDEASNEGENPFIRSGAFATKCSLCNLSPLIVPSFVLLRFMGNFIIEMSLTSRSISRLGVGRFLRRCITGLQADSDIVISGFQHLDIFHHRHLFSLQVSFLPPKHLPRFSFRPLNLFWAARKRVCGSSKLSRQTKGTRESN